MFKIYGRCAPTPPPPSPLPFQFQFQAEVRFVYWRDLFRGGRGVAAVAHVNHGGATIGLGWLRDGRGDISAGDEDAGRPWAGRPGRMAARTPPPRTSLRDGRRRGSGAFLPRRLQRGEGSACLVSRTTASMSSWTRPPVGGAGVGAVSANEGRGGRRHLEVPRRGRGDATAYERDHVGTAAGDVDVDDTAGDRRSRGCRRGQATARPASVDVAAAE